MAWSDPHLENPADFPKPVFIWRGSCRHTPQLIYITVRLSQNLISLLKTHCTLFRCCLGYLYLKVWNINKEKTVNNSLYILAVWTTWSRKTTRYALSISL